MSSPSNGESRSAHAGSGGAKGGDRPRDAARQHADADNAPIHRFEVYPATGQSDPIGEGLVREAGTLGLAVDRARTAHVYLIQAELSAAQLGLLTDRLLADPITERVVRGSEPPASGDRVLEIHPLPGVMDPVAQSVELAVQQLTGAASRVSTGWRFDLRGVNDQQADAIGARLLANPVVQRVLRTPWTPERFATAAPHAHSVRRVPVMNLTDDQLVKLSRDAHLFLSLDEMRALRAEAQRTGADPTEIELETLAQTWSEHCVHKTLKSTITYREDRPGADWPDLFAKPRPGVTRNPDGSVTIANLLKSTVAAATFELIADGVDWTLSVFKDNSGVIALDDRFGVCIKVETHNHPSAIEPYGGSATGIGGCIRDVMGTGLGARPIASTDVFCVAHPDRFAQRALDGTASASTPAGADGAERDLPPGCLHPRRTLTQVVAGVRDYGNRMGIPTVAGAVAFDDRYIGNPLVFAGCVGLIPRRLVKGGAKPGDRIIALGGKTGRDGIHGATFSSAELEHTAADEFAHAVQIGNAIEQKKTLDAILRARDAQADPDAAPAPLFNAITDCGAGGFSSAVGEMGAALGARVTLETAPLKYAGLSPTEIWISEAQERMVLAVPPANVPRLADICREEGVTLADLGEFGTPGQDLLLTFRGEEIGRLSMHFLHEGIPMPTRQAHWTAPPLPAAPGTGTGTGTGSPAAAATRPGRAADHAAMLRRVLAHPAVASKHWIIRQYDHEVQGGTVLKPLVGPHARGPGDASVIEPVAGSGRGIAIACGLSTGIGDPRRGGDPYLMALAAIDEAVRNLVCVGADPARVAILDNFCWPSCQRPDNLATLVRAAVGCYDGAKAYRTPFVSGKDSLNNQLRLDDGRVIQIPPTLLITGLGIVPSVDRCVSMDAKHAGSALVLVGATGRFLGGSIWQELADPLDDTLGESGLGAGARLGCPAYDPRVPRADLDLGPRAALAVARLIAAGLVRAAHDCSDGGVLAAVAEMLIAGSTDREPLGARLTPGAIPWKSQPGPLHAALFVETPGRYVLEVAPSDLPAVTAALADLPHAVVGQLNASGRLTVDLADIDEPVDRLAAAWLGTLDW